MFRYRLHSPDGDDLGESTFAVMIQPSEEILVGNGRLLRALDVVPFEEEAPFVGLLQVEAAWGRQGSTCPERGEGAARRPKG